jgi:hypothetical protein
MARTDSYKNVKRFCIMCTNEIPADRKKDAVTCSKDCSAARANYLRSRRDATECRYCNKPSTPEERVLFSSYKKWLKQNEANPDFAAQLADVKRLSRENERLKHTVAELQEASRPTMEGESTGKNEQKASERRDDEPGEQRDRRTRMDS